MDTRPPSIVLAAMVFESAIAWIRYHEKDTGRKAACAYFLEVTPESSLTRAIEEVFVIRDIIAHGHLWEGPIIWDENHALQFADPPILQEGYGDKKFQNVLDPQTRCSKHLKLNLFPSRIWRHDAYLVRNTVVQGLRSLEARNPAYYHFANQIYGFQGRACRFYQIVEALSDLGQTGAQEPECRGEV